MLKFYSLFKDPAGPRFKDKSSSGPSRINYSHFCAPIAFPFLKSICQRKHFINLSINYYGIKKKILLVSYMSLEVFSHQMTCLGIPVSRLNSIPCIPQSVLHVVVAH